ncbi:MAG: response regulator [Archaeoglobaceae archaeon]|nr:response regulator [Archaeoglobaceae archaeon]MCX8152562.1 response regulator [Archaeoglobaceae archaeon]MDW8014156.1 response regulator [Archaeoglobaceae archaeon]
MTTKPKILVVEDDLALLEVLKIMLQEEFEVILATDGKSAVKIYETYKPDLVLMDIALPEMNGVEATKEIVKRDPNAKIIAVSAYARSRGKEILDVGAKETLEKPFTKKKLIEIIKKYLN